MSSKDPSLIDFYVKSYRTLLSGGGEIFIRDLENLHKNIDSTLHNNANTEEFDKFAFGYAHLRLPAEISKTNLVILGQSDQVFKNAGYQDVNAWKNVQALARRRKMIFDRKGNLGMFVSSISDVDDIVTALTAYQIEWNKLNELLNKDPNYLHVDDFSKLIPNHKKLVTEVKSRKLDIKVKQLGGSKVDYTKAIQRWWKNISIGLKPQININHRPLYVISSNLHSLSNLLVPFAKNIQNKVIKYVQNNPELGSIFDDINKVKKVGQREDFLYFATKKYISTLNEVERNKILAERSKLEKKRGLSTILAQHYLDINAQIIPVNKINFENVDPRIAVNKKLVKHLKKSNALILNFDYPLGFGAYGLLEEILENAQEIRGFYVLGKAATLNGETGNVMIPNIVEDVHSGNTYFFSNCFSVKDVAPFLYRTSVIDSQKSVTVLGTFLQNRETVDSYIDKDISIAEMEAGPYLNAIYESCFASRYPNGSMINLTNIPFDFGILNYASDTHYLRGKSLGSGPLSFEGVSPTYVSTAVILNRIFKKELEY